MDVKQAVMAFSQSEKIKSGIVWVSHVLGRMIDLQFQERQGAEKVISLIVGMIAQEIHLAKTLTEDAQWDEIDRAFDQSLVMINSGVGPESITQLTRVLSMVTNIGQRSMTMLKDNDLL